MFTRFGTMADARAGANHSRRRIRAVLRQPQFAPLWLGDEVSLAIALREGLLDAVPANAISDLRQALPRWLDQHAGVAVANIERNGTMTDGEAISLRSAVAELVQQQGGNG